MNKQDALMWLSNIKTELGGKKGTAKLRKKIASMIRFLTLFKVENSNIPQLMVNEISNELKNL